MTLKEEARRRDSLFESLSGATFPDSDCSGLRSTIVLALSTSGSLFVSESGTSLEASEAAHCCCSSCCSSRSSNDSSIELERQTPHEEDDQTQEEEDSHSLYGGGVEGIVVAVSSSVFV